MPFHLFQRARKRERASERSEGMTDGYSFLFCKSEGKKIKVEHIFLLRRNRSAAVVISVAFNVYFQFRQSLYLVNLTILLALESIHIPM